MVELGATVSVACDFHSWSHRGWAEPNILPKHSEANRPNSHRLHKHGEPCGARQAPSRAPEPRHYNQLRTPSVPVTSLETSFQMVTVPTARSWDVWEPGLPQHNPRRILGKPKHNCSLDRRWPQPHNHTRNHWPSAHRHSTIKCRRRRPRVNQQQTKR